MVSSTAHRKYERLVTRMNKNYTQMELANSAYQRVYKRNPDIAGEVYADTLERINRGVSESFRADYYFFKVFKLKNSATPREKGRNNFKEVNMVSIDLETDTNCTPKGTISDVVALEIDEGFEEVDNRVSLIETMAKLRDEVELNNLPFDDLVDALQQRLEDSEDRIISEVALSTFVTIPEISELLLETLKFEGALKALISY